MWQVDVNKTTDFFFEHCWKIWYLQVEREQLYSDLTTHCLLSSPTQSVSVLYSPPKASLSNYVHTHAIKYLLVKSKWMNILRCYESHTFIYKDICPHIPSSPPWGATMVNLNECRHWEGAGSLWWSWKSSEGQGVISIYICIDIIHRYRYT